MLEIEMKFRLKWIELDLLYGLYKKIIKIKLGMLREQRQIIIFLFLSILLYIFKVLVVWKVVDIEGLLVRDLQVLFCFIYRIIYETKQVVGRCCSNVVTQKEISIQVVGVMLLECRGFSQCIQIGSFEFVISYFVIQMIVLRKM